MDFLKTIYTGILILFVFNETYSQENNKTKPYFTSDSLSFIYLFPNNKFGYISYQGESPFSYYFDKNKTKGSIDGPYFSLNEKGFGKYTLDKNKLNLKFITPKHPVDSISKKYYRSTKLNDSLSIKIIIKPYYSNTVTYGMIGVGTRITSKDNSINLNTGFESEIEFKIGENQLPLKLFINGKYSLTIDKNKNQIIELYFNRFKRMTTDNIENKTFDFSKLTKMTTK